MYDYLDRMRPGRAVTFRRYTGERLEWCLLTAATFFLEGDHWREFRFSDDFLTLYREKQRPALRCRGFTPPRFGPVTFKQQHPGRTVQLNTRI